MRWLKIVLWLGAIGCMLSVFGLFLPMSTLARLAKVLGGVEWPTAPVFVYAVRVISATYIVIGVFLAILAVRPQKYAGLVRFSAAASIFGAIVCAATGIMHGLPILLFLGDSVSLAAFGVAVLILQGRAAKEAE